jgi:hypothetical protein
MHASVLEMIEQISLDAILQTNQPTNQPTNQQFHTYVPSMVASMPSEVLGSAA